MRSSVLAAPYGTRLAHRLSGGRLPPYSVAMVRMYAGRHDEALALLQASAQALDPAFIFANIEPAFDALRDDPRFTAMLRDARARPAGPASLTSDTP